MLKFQIDGVKAYNITSNEKQEVHFITLAFIYCQKLATELSSIGILYLISQFKAKADTLWNKCICHFPSCQLFREVKRGQS